MLQKVFQHIVDNGREEEKRTTSAIASTSYNFKKNIQAVASMEIYRLLLQRKSFCSTHAYVFFCE